jgi:hypothetical protein
MSRMKDLFGDEPFEAYARGSDPQTSHDAAASLDEDTLANMEALALQATRSCGERGMINDDLVRLTRLPWESITPRMAQLQEKGFVRTKIDPTTGKVMKRQGKKGRGQQVYFATGGKYK